MSAAKHQFKDALAEHFGENLEKRHISELVLEEHLQEYGESGCEAAALRINSSNGLSPSCWRLLLSAVFFVGLIVVTFNCWQTYRVRGMIYLPGVYTTFGSTNSWGGQFDHLSQDERILLFGDESQSGISNRMKALWDLDPENPVYYMEYAMAYHEEYGNLPSDFIQVGDRIDSGNGWYRLFTAAVLAKGSVSKKTTASRRRTRSKSGKCSKRTPGPKPEWDILDQTNYGLALQYFSEAASMPICKSHGKELLSERTHLLPKDGDFITRLVPVTYLASQRMSAIQLNYLWKVLSAEAERCETSKDNKSLENLVSDSDTIGRILLEDGYTLVDVLIAQALISTPLRNIEEAGKSCGMNDVESRAKTLRQHFDDRRDRRDGRRDSEERELSDQKFQYEAGILHSMSMPVIENMVDDKSSIDPIDLKPGRLVDHAFLGRLLSVCGWVIFASLSLAVFLDSLRVNRVVRSIAVSARSVYDWSDWCKIFGLGVGLPLIYYWLIHEQSSWSVRKVSVVAGGMASSIGPFVSLCLLLITSISLVVRWRCRVNLPMLGMRWNKLAWASLVLSAVSLPTFGATLDSSSLHEAHWWVWSLPVLALICFLVEWFRNFWGQKNKLRGQLLVSIILPVYLCLTLVFAMGVLYYHAQERYWVKQDELFVITPEEPGFTRIEYQITEQCKREVRELMGWNN